MAGGLLQISTYGAQDLYLTGSPEITFFDVVYRRYTNFSLESVEIPFDDLTGFGIASSVVVPKIGDLVQKIYIKVELPEIQLSRVAPGNQLDNELLAAQTIYSYVLNFMQVNIQAYRNGIEQYKSINTTAEDIISSVETSFTIDNFDTIIEVQFTDALNTTNYNYSLISMKEIVKQFRDLGSTSSGNILPSVTKDMVINALNAGLLNSNSIQSFFYNKIQAIKDIISDNINKVANFAWVKKIGHSIIDYVEVLIGGDVIDKHYGDWLNIWHELTSNDKMDIIYNKMIGNVNVLNVPSRVKKPKYILYIPLQFWFCRHNGLALPLVALEYHDITFRIKFRKFHECSYLSELTNEEKNDSALRKARINQLQITRLDTYVEQSENDLNATLLVDYVYLDGNERKKFAQSSHEYLIEQVQLTDFDNVSAQQFQDILNLNHPCKEIIWVAQQVSKVDYNDGYDELRYDDYTVNIGTLLLPKLVNPISYSSIDFNGHSRVIRLDSNYFNYVQPYQHHKRSPSLGVNVYSFSLFPEEYQPSGSCNMSKIPRIMLKLEFNTNIDPNISFNIKVYGINHNALRFTSGMAGLVFV